MNRNMYHPVAIGADFVRKNVFELIVPDTSMNAINLLCRTITITLPNTNAVQVPWIGGIMQVAGKLSQAFSFNASFLVGLDDQYDAFKALYTWRQLVFNHDTGQIQLASSYKRTGTILVYDVTGDTLKYQIDCEGMWPTNVPDISLEVSDDGVLEVSSQFAADKIQVTNL